MSKKIQSIVVDTVNAIQNNQYMSMLDKKTMVTRDKWKDFGVDIYMFMDKLKSLGFEVVLVLGYEGSGKSYGIKYLEPETNIWFNADNKNPTFKSIEYGGEKFKPREVYGTKNKPTRFMTVPENFSDIIGYIEEVEKGGMLSETPVAFLVGHIEEYRTGNDEIRQRLKTLGSLASKMNIEGSVEYCLYSKLNPQGDKVEFKLDTINSGTNTARSSEEAFPTRYIDNNFHTVLDAIINY
tara:strand:+ start:3332 stop:4045 length:714 start_codon:yes stop_codon:yes gene_type:complete